MILFDHKDSFVQSFMLNALEVDKQKLKVIVRVKKVG